MSTNNFPPLVPSYLLGEERLLNQLAHGISQDRLHVMALDERLVPEKSSSHLAEDPLVPEIAQEVPVATFSPASAEPYELGDFTD